MAVEIKLPNLGDGITSGDVLSLLVKEGDQIQKDQAIVELETGKATIEVPSSHAGKVVKIHVAQGQSVPIGGLLITLDGVATAEAPKAAPAKPAAAQVRPAAAPAKPAPQAPAPQAVTPQAPVAPAPAKPAATVAAPVSRPAVAPSKTTSEPVSPAPTVVAKSPDASVAGGAIPASPSVRRFAREVGVDLGKVAGSAEGGRISRDDVLSVVRHASQSVHSGSGAASATAPPTTPKGPGESSTDTWGPVRVERMAKIRRTIAEKMHESWTTVPRVTNFDDADVTELEKFRQASKDDYLTQGIKLTSLPFVVKALAMALRNHPVLNASVDMENGQIIYKDYVNIGIAVDSDRGLVVPSLRNADKLSIPEIARGIANLAEAVRNSSFTIDDLRGSTFSISNLGAIGGTFSTPIINTPEVAILLVGRSRKMPVVVDDQIAIRLMMPLSLSYDHRIVDGAAAARFLNDVISYLKAPSRLLLAP